MLTLNSFLIASAEGGHHGLSMKAPELFTILGFPITNSMLISWVVAVAIIAFAQYATRQIKMVPDGAQNFWETVIEGLGGLLEEILGHALMKASFWFFASIFIFIVSCNLFALIPGVGTIVRLPEGSYPTFSWVPVSLSDVTPYMRGANADVNLPAAMAVVFMVLWLFWSLQFNGIKGFLHHLFGPKADMPGILGVVLIVVCLGVGVIEVISIMVRPVSLTFRLFGNIFGGEVMIETLMEQFGNFSFLVLIPVYAFETLVAVVQALVFCLLTAVFTGVMCKHEEEHH